jgi:hypothetical protein
VESWEVRGTMSKGKGIEGELAWTLKIYTPSDKARLQGEPKIKLLGA